MSIELLIYNIYYYYWRSTVKPYKTRPHQFCNSYDWQKNRTHVKTFNPSDNIIKQDYKRKNTHFNDQ